MLLPYYISSSYTAYDKGNPYTVPRSALLHTYFECRVFDLLGGNIHKLID